MSNTQTTKSAILESVVELFATQGYEQMSMRSLAKQVGVAPSVLYHHFASKDDVLQSMYKYANHTLGTARAQLPVQQSASDHLRQIISFQLDHATLVIAVLKYYFAYREVFAQSFPALPPKAALHIEEVLAHGIADGEYRQDVMGDAKVIAHIINGFLLEYFPHLPKEPERTALVNQIAAFVERAIQK